MVCVLPEDRTKLWDRAARPRKLCSNSWHWLALQNRYKCYIFATCYLLGVARSP